MKRKNVFAILLIAALLLGGCAAAPATPATEPQIVETQPVEETSKMSAPDFTVYDLEGNPVMLSDFLGKPIVLNFWASWCGPCKQEMPAFEEKYLELGDEVHFLIVNLTEGVDETVETASAYVESQGYTFPVYYDTTSEAGLSYAVRSIPTTFFLDAEGNVITYAVGAISGDILQQGIDMIRNP